MTALNPKGYEVMGGVAGLAFTLTILAVDIGRLICSSRVTGKLILH